MPKTSRVEDRSSIESMLERLEQITERLGAGEATLEQSAALYQEGVDLVRRCRDQLKSTRSRIQKLNRLTGKLDTFKFTEADSE